MKRWLWATAAAAVWAGVSPAAGPVPAQPTSTVVGQVAEGEVRVLKTTGLPDRQVRVLRLPKPEDRTVLAEVQDLANGSTYTVPVRVLAAAKNLPELFAPTTTAAAALAGRSGTPGRPPAHPPASTPEPKKPGFLGKLFGAKEPARPAHAPTVPSPSAVESMGAVTAAVQPPAHPEPAKSAAPALPFVNPSIPPGGTVLPAGGVEPPPVLTPPPGPAVAVPPAIVPPTTVTPPIPAPAVPPILPPVPPPTPPRQPEPAPIPSPAPAALPTVPPPTVQVPPPVLAAVPTPSPTPEVTAPQPEVVRREVPAQPPARPVEHRLPAAADSFRPASGTADSVTEDVTRLVTELHTATRPSIRELAATSLVEAGHASRPSVQSALARAATTDEAPSVRATCIRLLSNLGYRDVGYLDHLKACEESSVPELRAAAVAALAKLSSGR